MEKARIFLIATVLGATLASASSSSAYFRRESAHACFASSTDLSKIKVQNNGLYNDSDTTIGLSCPVPDDTSLQDYQVQLVNVHANVGTFGCVGTAARACAVYWNANGGECGNVDGGSCPGESTMDLARADTDLTAWSSAHSHFPYLFVTLGNRSVLKGWFLRT